MHKILKRLKKDNEQGARKAVIEDLFYDFHRNRHQVYLTNFVRGVFFGFGSVIGATLLIGLVAALLGIFTDVPGGVGDFVQKVIDAMNKPQS